MRSAFTSRNFRSPFRKSEPGAGAPFCPDSRTRSITASEATRWRCSPASTNGVRREAGSEVVERHARGSIERLMQIRHPLGSAFRDEEATVTHRQPPVRRTAARSSGRGRLSMHRAGSRTPAPRSVRARAPVHGAGKVSRQGCPNLVLRAITEPLLPLARRPAARYRPLTSSWPESPISDARSCLRTDTRATLTRRSCANGRT